MTLALDNLTSLPADGLGLRSARRVFDPRLIDIALARRPADLVLRGGRVLAVHTGEVIEADIVIAHGRIARVGRSDDTIGPDTQVIDLDGRYAIPGLIDGHLHVESARLSMSELSDVLVAAGTTSVVSGLDHIAAVGGPDAVRASLDEAARADLMIFWGSPFRLPYTIPAPAIPYSWTAADFALTHGWPECFGIWEVAPGFIDTHEPQAIASARLAAEFGLKVAGCVPEAGEAMDLVAAHLVAGLRVDHEAFGVDELLAKLRLGMFSFLRDSPIERFLDRLVPLVVDRPELSHLVGLCTDGFDARDVRDNGHIMRMVRESIGHGLDTVKALQMATINTARAYGVDDVVGSITPGLRADILVSDSLDQLTPSLVIAAGRVAAREGRSLRSRDVTVHETLPFTRPDLGADAFVIGAPVRDVVATCRVFELTDNAFHRRLVERAVPVHAGRLAPAPSSDIAFVAYVDRGGCVEKPGLGLVSGFGLRAGAIATSFTPDDQNIVCVGTDADDMALAVNEVSRRGGGDIIAVDGVVVEFLALPIFGLMSDGSAEEVIAAQDALIETLRTLGCGVTDPFRFLGLLAITGVADGGMSDIGPVDAATREVFDVVITCDSGDSIGAAG